MKLGFIKIKKNELTPDDKSEKITDTKADQAEKNISIGKANVLKAHDWKTSLVLLLLAVPLYFYFSFGQNHLAQFETADEYRWAYNSDSRIPKYWRAMLSKDWEHTMINDKPGISTAIVSGLGMWYLNEDNLTGRIVTQNDSSTVFNPQASQIINFAFRLPLLAFNGLLSILWYFLIRRLAKNNWLALLACSLILLNPILIGISQIINPDAMLWSTAFTSILAFLLFLKYRKWYDALLFGFFFGFALLSKYTAVVIIPFAFLLMGAYFIYKYNGFIKEKVFRKRSLQYFLSFPFMTALGVLIYSLLLPIVFLNPKLLLKGNDAFKAMRHYVIIMEQVSGAIILDAIIFKSWIFKKVLFLFKFLWNIGSRVIFGILLFFLTLEAWNWTHGNFLGIPEIPYDTGTGKAFTQLPLIQKIFLEIHPLVFSLTPVVLAMLLIAWSIYLFKRNVRFAFPFFSLSIFLPIFYLAVLQEKLLVHIRYSVILYPIVILIAASGLTEILNLLKFRFNFIFKIAAFALVVWLSVLSLKQIQPFYFNYTNEFLPKNYTITGAWGYGGYEAAQYINSQSDHPEKLIVWTDYDGFCPFFPGTCIKDSEIKWVGFKTTNAINYYVITPRGSSKLSNTFSKLLPNISTKPDWELSIGDRPNNSIWVYKVIKSDFKNNDWWRKSKEDTPITNKQKKQ